MSHLVELWIGTERRVWRGRVHTKSSVSDLALSPLLGAPDRDYLVCQVMEFRDTGEVKETGVPGERVRIYRYERTR